MASTVWGLISSPNPNWNAVRERIGTHPSEANCCVTKPLKVAVRHESVPPVDIITSLVSSHQRQQHRSRSHNSTTRLSEGEKLDILTEACYNSNMKANIVMVLLEAFDLKPSMEFVYRLIKDILSFQKEVIEDDHERWVHPFHNNNGDMGYGAMSIEQGDLGPSSSLSLSCPVAALIQYYPNVLSTRDKNGNILLHHACNKGNIGVQLIGAMIDISIRNNLHIDDFHISDNFDANIDTPYVFNSNNNNNNHHHGGLMITNRQNRTPLQNLIRIIDDNNNEKALEKILCCYQKCPNVPILHLAITSVSKPRYFKVLMELLEENVGATYLHTTKYKNRSLLKAAIENASFNVKNSKKKQDLQHARGIIQILIYWPCRTPDLGQEGNDVICEELKVSHYRDEKKRLPIHYACDLGLSFCGGLEDIVKSNISALEDVDEVTGLLPFMLAAAASTCARTCAIYQLLRRNPNQIQSLRQR